MNSQFKIEVQTMAKTAKAHLVKHKTKYAVAITAVILYKFHRSTVKEWIAFLEAKGIDPIEFLCPEAFEEMKAI